MDPGGRVTGPQGRALPFQGTSAVCPPKMTLSAVRELPGSEGERKEGSWEAAGTNNQARHREEPGTETWEPLPQCPGDVRRHPQSC